MIDNQNVIEHDATVIFGVNIKIVVEFDEDLVWSEYIYINFYL